MGAWLLFSKQSLSEMPPDGLVAVGGILFSVLLCGPDIDNLCGAFVFRSALQKLVESIGWQE